LADRVDNVRIIDALRNQANTFRRETPQECATAFIDICGIKDQIYGFTIADRLLAAGLNQFGALRGNLA
jgi:hypothetical protein